MVWLMERVERAEAALRTAEESSVVDGTPAKQSQNAENADGDGDILNDIETSLRAKTDGMKRLLESQTLSPELAAPDMLGAMEEVVAITENLPVCPFCGAVKAVQSHRLDCLSHEIDAAIRKARGEE